MAETARISPKSNELIEEIEEITGESKIRIIEAALQAYIHHERMRLLNESYRKLQANEEAWKEEMEERKILEGTIADGIDEE